MLSLLFGCTFVADQGDTCFLTGRQIGWFGGAVVVKSSDRCPAAKLDMRLQGGGQKASVAQELKKCHLAATAVASSPSSLTTTPNHSADFGASRDMSRQDGEGDNKGAQQSA